MKDKALIMIAIILLFILIIMVLFFILDYTTERRDFCEAKGGEWLVIGGGSDCLIEETGVITKYQVVKFKGEWRLQK